MFYYSLGKIKNKTTVSLITAYLARACFIIVEIVVNRL
jgi:hypothetical protein